jgi:hypothetical protein
MSSQTAIPNSEAAIWARLFQSEETEVTPEVARYLLAIRFPAADEDRVNELSAKAQAGTLTEAETQELDSYLHLGSLLAVMQSKARQFLKQTGSSHTRQ